MVHDIRAFLSVVKPLYIAMSPLIYKLKTATISFCGVGYNVTCLWPIITKGFF